MLFQDCGDADHHAAWGRNEPPFGLAYPANLPQYRSFTEGLSTEATQALVYYAADRSDPSPRPRDAWGAFVKPDEWYEHPALAWHDTVQTPMVAGGGGAAAAADLGTRELLYGYGGFSETCDSDWQVEDGNRWGRICAPDTDLPFYSGFGQYAVPRERIGGKTLGVTHCASSGELFAAAECEPSKPFTIALRKVPTSCEDGSIAVLDERKRRIWPDGDLASSGEDVVCKPRQPDENEL